MLKEKSKTKTPNHLPKEIAPPDGPGVVRLRVPPPNLPVVSFEIVGTRGLLMARFSEKAQGAMAEKMLEDEQLAKRRKPRKKRDFEQEFKDAQHRSEEGWLGFPASGFRSAMITACKLVGLHMTLAKISCFVIGDGIDEHEKIDLVRINGDPRLHRMACRNANGSADLRTRAFIEQWSAIVQVQYDADQFKQVDIANLLWRAGMQVGIGEGRHDGRKGNGLGFGTFKLK